MLNTFFFFCWFFGDDIILAQVFVQSKIAYERISGQMRVKGAEGREEDNNAQTMENVRLRSENSWEKCIHLGPKV